MNLNTAGPTSTNAARTTGTNAARTGSAPLDVLNTGSELRTNDQQHVTLDLEGTEPAPPTQPLDGDAVQQVLNKLNCSEPAKANASMAACMSGTVCSLAALTACTVYGLTDPSTLASAVVSSGVVGGGLACLASLYWQNRSHQQ